MFFCDIWWHLFFIFRVDIYDGVEVYYPFRGIENRWWSEKIDEVIWEKLRSVVNIRSQLLRVTKYDSIVNNFPDELEETFGYHSTCYKNFTAVPKNVHYNSSSNSMVRTLRLSEPTHITSPTGVYHPSVYFVTR